jgi:hypothetical protein
LAAQRPVTNSAGVKRKKQQKTETHYTRNGVSYDDDDDKKNKPVGFVVLTVAVIIVAIFWDIAPCSPYVYLCFG